MQIVWDWRLARVYDTDGEVFDECIWDENRSIDSLVERLTLLMEGRMTSEARTLAERFPEAKVTTTTSIDSWPELESEEKNSISHRGKAMRKLIDFLLQ